MQSIVGELDLTFQCIGKGTLSIALRGKFVKDTNENRVPIWIDYTQFTVNGTVMIHDSMPVCHDKPFRYSMSVDDGDLIQLHLEWEPHDPKKQIGE